MRALYYLCRRLLLVICIGLSFIATISHAENQLKPFDSDSMKQIEEARLGESFVVVLWSIECPPCLKELKLLSRLKSDPLLTRLVLISTDGEDYRQELENLLSAEQVMAYENWVFSDPLPERLRYKVDPNWYGELPRSYFYDAEGKRRAHSGLLTEASLNKWLNTEAASL